MTQVFKKWWLAKIAASIHFKDQSYSAYFFYMAGRLDYWKCQKKEWSAKMLSFHHSLKLRYMFAKQVASIGIQWAISPPLPFYQGLMSEPPSPMDWMLPKATPKMAVFKGRKNDSIGPDGIWKKWDGSSFFSQRSSVDWRRWKWFNDPDSLSHAISRKNTKAYLLTWSVSRDVICQRVVVLFETEIQNEEKWQLWHIANEKIVPGDEDKNLLISIPRKYRGIWGWLFDSYHWIPSEHSKNTIDSPIECLTWNVLPWVVFHRETRRFKIIAVIASRTLRCKPAAG